MHPQELENWKKIESHFREKGLTETMWYKRALKISNGEPDPLAVKLPKLEE